MSDNIGIYKITNVTNGKAYVGQSVNISKRIRTHKSTLKSGKHYNEHLQRAWNKYGEANFSFVILESTEIEILTERENYWMDYYNSFEYENGYNSLKPSENKKSYQNSEEAKEKMRISSTKYSDEELISYLQEFFYMEGRVPNSRERMTDMGYPSIGTFEIRFGNIKNALIASDLFIFSKNSKSYDRKVVSKQDVILNFEKFIIKNKRFPSSSEQRETNSSGLYNTTIVLKHFSNIQELKDVFGLTKEKEIKRENEESIVLLKKLYSTQGFVDFRSIDKSRITRSTKFYGNRFGSLLTAYELAGIDIEENKKSFKLYKHKLKIADCL